jgi:hypothetical protein
MHFATKHNATKSQVTCITKSSIMTNKVAIPWDSSMTDHDNHLAAINAFCRRYRFYTDGPHPINGCWTGLDQMTWVACPSPSMIDVQSPSSNN